MSAFSGSLCLFLALAAGGGEEPPVTVDRVRAILVRARPHLVEATGLPWPDDLTIEATDPAGLKAILRSEFEAQVAALHPERPASSRRLLVNVLVDSFARVVRAKYGLESGRIHVARGAVERLPEGVDAEDALVAIVVHEAVHAMDDAAAPIGERILEAASDPEALRALRMVVEGRAEHYSGIVLGRLGVEPSVARRLAANRDPAERLTREAGARFVAALTARDPLLPVRALREPPRSTSIVFHPGRFGAEDAPVDLDARLAGAMPGATPEPLSELFLRARFLTRMGSESVERAFSGFVAGRSARVASGRRVSVVRCEDEESAALFLRGLLEFEGAAEDEEKELLAPGGRTFRWRAAREGALVAEALSPDVDPVRLLEAALPPAED